MITLALAILLVLGACVSTDGVRTIRGDWSGYSLSYVQHAAMQGALPTIIAGGAVSGVSSQAFSKRVREEMSGSPLGVGPLSFTAMPAGSAKPALFISLVFNPVPNFDSKAACDPARAGQAGGEPNSDGSARVVAAFCSNQRLLSGTVGLIGGLTGLDDPRLAALIRLVMIDLFPPHDPSLGPSCDSCP